MLRVDKFWKIAANNLKCIRTRENITSSQSVQFVRYFQITTAQRNNIVAVVKKDIIANFCQTFHCSEDSANRIYDKFPSLRSIDAIQNDTLEILQSKLSAQSIVENPTLVAMDNSEMIYFFLSIWPFFSMIQTFFRNIDSQNRTC